MNSMNLGKNLHHAYCIVGETSTSKKEVENFLLEQLQFPITGNPDFYFAEFDVMKAEDVESIIFAHQNMPSQEDKKIFIIGANFITEQTQNKFLKIFEEPKGGTHFFLLVPSANGIIPTLKSRMLIISSRQDSKSFIDVKKFLDGSVGERMGDIKDLMEEIKDEEKSKIEVITFINALEVEMKKNLDLKKNRELFEIIEKVRHFAGEQSPSLKMLLEYLALVIPCV